MADDTKPQKSLSERWEALVGAVASPFRTAASVLSGDRPASGPVKFAPNEIELKRRGGERTYVSSTAECLSQAVEMTSVKLVPAGGQHTESFSCDLTKLRQSAAFEVTKTCQPAEGDKKPVCSTKASTDKLAFK